MNSNFRELVERIESYEFRELDTIPVTGILRKSPDNRDSCILVISSDSSGDLVVEVGLDDVVRHEAAKTEGMPAEDQVTLHVKSTAILTTSFRGKITNALIPAFIVTSSFGGLIRGPIPTAPWRGIVTPFSRLDVLLNIADGLDWMECRANGKAECEAHHPPGPDRDQCITAKYIDCGPPPKLRVDEGDLEQLLGLVKGHIER